MPSTISAGTTAGTAIAVAGDTTGNLAFQTNGTTTAMTINTSQNVGIGTSTFSAGGLLTLNRAPTAAFGSPILQIGGSSYTSGGYYSLGLGFTDATYTEPPAEIAYVPTSDSGGTKGAIVFGNRDVTTNTAVSERMRITSGGFVGIGETNPNTILHANGDIRSTNAATNFSRFSFGQYGSPGTSYTFIQGDARDTGYMAFYTNVTEQMRIDNSGNLLVNTTSNITGTGGKVALKFDGSATWGMAIQTTYGGGTGSRYMQFVNSAGSETGNINQNGTTTVAYSTSSDYRLKDNVVPMIGALDKVLALKPCTYTWKVDGSDGQGFIAHELQEVCPDAVSGEKDAVETYTDEDGNEQTRIKPQGIDTSFLVATLTAAIQELNAKVDAQALEIQALKGVA